MKRMIKEYQQETDFVNAGAGTATWCIATKGGKKYFVKSFLEVTLVDEETAKNLPAPMVEAKRKSCIQFRVRKERLYNRLNEIQNGVFISPIELIVHNGHFCAVTDYLESFSDSDNIHKLTPRRKTILMRTIVLAMRDLANSHIVHSDIKPDNIVITYNQKKIPQLKIIDFDSGFFEDAPPHNVNEYHGDMVYFAPESMVFLQSEGESAVRLTCAVDKFAVGLLLHKMWCGMLPTYDTKECANVAEALLLDKPIKLHGSIPTKLSTVINGFLQEDPDARMNYDQAYNLLGEYLSELPEDKSEIVPDSGTKPVSDKETEVRVEYVDMNGSVLESTTLTLACGSTLTVFPKTIDGYESIDGKRDVRVDESGHAEPSSIIFKYKKKSHSAWLWIIAALGAVLLWWLFTAGSANAAISRSNWEEASMYSSLCPFFDVIYPDEMQSINYNNGIRLYHSRQYEEAMTALNRVPSTVKDCGKYKTLCSAHKYGAASYVDSLSSMVGFEDADSLILSSQTSFVEKFMCGTWAVSTDNSSYSDYVVYQGDNGGWWMTSIPDRPGDGYWGYIPGYLQFQLKDSSDGYYNLHEIKILSMNKVTFTNCKTDRKYTLIRK